MVIITDTACFGIFEGVWLLHEAGRKEGEGQIERWENAKSVIQNIQIIL